MTKLTMTDLAAETVELLPSRETLVFDLNWTGILASNSSVALNAVTLGSVANSAAGQFITVTQG
ncbi:hypothetical protein [Sinomonas terrae]|uniref:Uncharacterized protein n=1 Tax=Sinomonas terrae TaxID=2908838 RepID=A0ABS9U639_9MICC|nr:hypothetical protein [Sinomonas terrae]MCH6472065.1 hypothetical protein [Sinomonas terrae]HKU11075.1 hypothetical protein [Sinomonas sp.]